MYADVNSFASISPAALAPACIVCPVIDETHHPSVFSLRTGLACIDGFKKKKYGRAPQWAGHARTTPSRTNFVW
jgi:hypothetical protein